MCWVLDGVFGAGACACNERVRLRVCSFVCLCPFARVHACLARVRAMCVCVGACAHVCVCVRLRVRPCACVYAWLCERMCGFVRFHRIAIPRVCIASGAVRALPSHGVGLRYL